MKRAALLLLLAACSSKKDSAAPARPPVAAVQARGVVGSPSGTHLAFLIDAKPPREPGVPDGILAGNLALVPARPGEAPTIVGRGVSTVQGGYAFAPDAKREGGLPALLFLRDYRHVDGAGTLTVARPGMPPADIAEGVTFWATNRDGRLLGLVAQGKLRVVRLAGAGLGTGSMVAPFETDSFGESVGSFAFAPAEAGGGGITVPPALAASLLYRVRAAKGGALHRVDLASRKDIELARNVTDFGWATDACPLWIARTPSGEQELHAGPGCPRAGRLAEHAQSFIVSSEGDRVAFVSELENTTSPFGELFLIALDKGGLPFPMGKRVSEFRFAPQGGALAWLQDYDAISRNGKLGVAAAGKPGRVQPLLAQAFSFDPTGRWLTFLHRNPQKMYTLELHLVEATPDADPRRMDEGVYGYQFSRDGQRLAYKARCLDEARSCTLFVVATAGGAPVEVAKKIAGFEFLPDGERLMLLVQGKMLGRTVDLAVVPARAGEVPRILDTLVDPSVRLLGDGGNVAYTVEEKGRLGVYVSPL